VINTCAVTVQAGAESRKLLRRVRREGAGEVIATGCWATFDPGGAAALPGVSRVVPNADKDRLVPLALGLPDEEVFDLEPVAREPLPGAQLRTRAYIKVQDGCDNRCTFCITTVARGAGRSRPLGDVLADIRAAVEGGTREVVLTGVHLGSWGQDLDAGLRIRDLVAAVLRATDAARLRLSSLEPWDLDRDFFNLWAVEPRLCRHLHLPLQSGCDRTLRRMARKTSQKSFRQLIRDARAACPEIAITTDLIAGFPGETEDEFEKTAAFVEEMEFAGAHVFPYSERPGTAAAAMPGQVDHPVRKSRAAALRRIVARSEHRYRAQFTGRTLDVLWENAAALGPDGWHLSGLTDNYLRVFAVAPRDLWNELTPVVLEEVTGEGMNGRIGE
jgi:threonylcarbamoyladenosine tRNA methylthiotransferase MtaB